MSVASRPRSSEWRIARGGSPVGEGCTNSLPPSRSRIGTRTRLREIECARCAGTCRAPVFPIALVEAPDAGRLREDRSGLSSKVAGDEQRLRCRHPVVELRRPMPGNRKRSDQGPRQSGRREAGLRGGVVLVDDPTQHVATADVAERRGSRGHCADRCGLKGASTPCRA